MESQEEIPGGMLEVISRWNPPLGFFSQRELLEQSSESTRDGIAISNFFRANSWRNLQCAPLVESLQETGGKFPVNSPVESLEEISGYNLARIYE